LFFLFFFSSRRRHTRWPRDWSSDVCSSDLDIESQVPQFFLEEARVLPQVLDELRLLLENVDCGNARRGHTRRMRRREQERPRAEIGRASCRERVEIAVGGGVGVIKDEGQRM